MWKLNLASVTYGHIFNVALLRKGPSARVNIRSKYLEKHSRTLIKKDCFFCEGFGPCFFATCYYSNAKTTF